MSRPGWHHVDSRDGTPVGWLRTDPRAADAAGAVPVVLCNGIACSVDYWTTLARRLRRERPVVQWDYRGHGVSGRPADPDAVTIDHVMDDLDAVLRAAAVPRAVFIGHSFGVQVALEAARRAPERVAAVVAIAGSPGAPLPPRAARPLTMVERLHQRMPSRADEAWRLWWTSPLLHLAARALGGTSLAAPRQVMLAYYEHVSTRDVPLLLAMMRTMQEHDASDVPALLDVPVLALAGDADGLTPLPVMAGVALDAPRGELAVCHGGTHTLPAERPDWVLEQLRPLLGRLDTAARHIDIPAGA
jgi:pimeloyl-ACP methyl ester carboxylesterase